MNCEQARLHLLDLRRGRLAPGLAHDVASHVEGCPACARAREEEEALDAALQKLPAHPASPALKRRLSALAASAVRLEAEDTRATAVPAARARAEVPAIPARPRRRWRAPAMAIAAGLLAAGTAGLVARTASRPAGGLDAFASEAVSDHLRVLQRERPVEVESTGRHDVKPWFVGKLDFAPAVPAPVGPEMQLVGGTLGYFLDRPSAVVVYRLRRHVVTLLAFRADGLAWPGAPADGDAGAPAQRALRGFHVFLWRSGGIAYALVGDADPAELSGIAAKLAAQT